jgi:hypothetical protein
MIPRGVSMLKQAVKKILDFAIIPVFQYCYDRIRLRSASSSASPPPPVYHQIHSYTRKSLYNFYIEKKYIVIFGNSYNAAYVAEIIFQSNEFTNKDKFIGYIVADEEKHYQEYCEYPIWNISDFPFPTEEVGVISAPSSRQSHDVITTLMKRGFTLDNVYIFEEPPCLLNENTLKNAVESILHSQYQVIIHGANREGVELHRRLREMNIHVIYFVADIPFSDTFDSLPLRSMYDLMFETMEDKFVFVVGSYPPGSLYDAGWNQQSAFFIAENIQFHSLLSQGGTYTQHNVHVQLDAHLGNNIYRGEKQGIRIWGNWDAQQAVKIVTLGGSTSDPFFADYSELYTSWSEMLYLRLQTFIPNITIACGGIVAYASTQELLKLIRDIVPQNPDLVIDFSIVNDLFKYFSYSSELDGSIEKKNHHKRPFLSFPTERFYRFAQENAVHNKLTEDARPVCFGVRDERNAVEFWIDTMRMMHALGQEFGFEFLGILQPNAATYRDGAVESFYTWGNPTFMQRKETYQLARERIAAYPYLLDYTTIFNELDENPYMDGAHVQPHGNRTIAEHMHQDILRLGLLRGRRA